MKSGRQFDPKFDAVTKLLSSNPEGLSLIDICKQTRIDAPGVYGFIYRSVEKGKVVRVRRGVYALAR